ncbi:hypothetical protein I6N95_05185 [Vagococcus sp. BWB3-3]|uniref:Uncharacterized protein n=1 Tax=Vagococcus allomyrinae TaxID=2794353 RepID=A0A940P8I9_9ENTE|nr:hypothetical protein [Vagococcus allomyrinae]MBP1040404.1 hypothetical protein [Vagococcus allomyrinae]
MKDINEIQKKTRDIIFGQLELLKEKAQETPDNYEIIHISEQMEKLASIILSKNFN